MKRSGMTNTLRRLVRRWKMWQRKRRDADRFVGCWENLFSAQARSLGYGSVDEMFRATWQDIHSNCTSITTLAHTFEGCAE